MNNSIVVRRLQACRNLERNACRLPYRQTALIFNVLFERDPLDQLHYNIVNPGLFPDIIDVYDIGVRKACCRLRLDPEF